MSGVLTFDDNGVSKQIFIPILDDGGQSQQNRDFLVLLTNAALDAAESPEVQTPRLDNVVQPDAGADIGLRTSIPKARAESQLAKNVVTIMIRLRAPPR